MTDDMITRAREAQAAQRLALHRALAGQPEPAPVESHAEGDTHEPMATCGFDGGAGREDQDWPIKPTPTHGELIAAMIRDSRGAGGTFGW